MCGIVGFFGSGDEHLLKTMTRTLAHRGPDGAGFHSDPENRVFLGHRRLAVLDLAGGRQPMWNEDHSVAVIFNGEIYNHDRLRADLEARGHRFQSHHSDTEVLVHGYEEWGEGLPVRLNGMFAFVIYDTNRRRLFLARDRFGKKPLFYAHRPGMLVFGSELRGVLLHPGVPDTPDGLALQKYFAHCFFPAPHTPYRAIRKLPGGCWLSLDLTGGEPHIETYWRFEVQPVETVPENAEERWAEELRELLATAVERRLESDVPLGFLLSGGIDSSAVLALASRYRSGDQLETFSMGFTEASYDESAHARFMADRIGSRHHALMCDLETARSELPSLLERWDEPIGDGSLLPTFLVNRFARQRVTVALSGDGGDELFDGYDPFKALNASRLYRRLVPARVHPLFQYFAGLMPISRRNMSLDFKVRRWLRGVGHPPAYWNPLWMGALAVEEISELFGGPVDPEILYEEALSAWESCPSSDLVDRTQTFFARFYLQDDILIKSDRASMLSSLELRSPFLDNDVAAFASRLPASFKFRRGQGKWLLKRALIGIVPERLIQRRKKGFGIPLADWLRALPPPAAGGVEESLMDGDWLRKRWRAHRQGRIDDRHGLWCWMTLHHHFTAHQSGLRADPMTIMPER